MKTASTFSPKSESRSARLSPMWQELSGVGILQRLGSERASSRVRSVSAKLGRFCPHYALNLFRKLVDSTRTIYNILTAILSIDGNGNLLFRFYLLFPCRLPSWCRLPAICLLSACYLPIPRRLPAVCLFVWSLWFVYIDTRLCHLR